MPVSRTLAALAAALVLVAPARADWEIPFGDGPDQVGRDAGDGHAGEAQPRGPQSFAVTRDGALILADTFKKRVLRIPAGQTTGTAIPRGLPFPADVDLHLDGHVLVGDRVSLKLTELTSALGKVKDYGAPGQLLSVDRVQWGYGFQTFAADEVKPQLVMFDGGAKPTALPYEGYGYALDEHHTLITPRFQRLGGFHLARRDRDGRALPSVPFDVGSPLAVTLLHAGSGTHTALVPIPGSATGKAVLLELEPGGRARELWRGIPLDATRTLVHGQDGRWYAAGIGRASYIVRSLPAPLTSTSAASVTTAPLARSRELMRLPSRGREPAVALVATGPALWLIRSDGSHARAELAAPGKVIEGKFDVPRLAGALAGPADELWLLPGVGPAVHRARQTAPHARLPDLQLAGWDRAPDLVTASAAGQVLTCDRTTAKWIKHKPDGTLDLKFDGAAPGLLDRRSELICVNDTDEPFGKAILQFDSNGNFLKIIAAFTETTRPTGVRFLGSAPDGDLLIGYWLGLTARIRRYTIDGAERPGFAIELPPAARVACPQMAITESGEIAIATSEGGDLVIRTFSKP